MQDWNQGLQQLLSEDRRRPSRRLSAPPARSRRESASVEDRLNTTLPTKWDDDAQAPSLDELREQHQRLVNSCARLDRENSRLRENNGGISDMYQRGAGYYGQLNKACRLKEKDLGTLFGQTQQSVNALENTLGLYQDSVAKNEELRKENALMDDHLSSMRKTLEKLRENVDVEGMKRIPTGVEQKGASYITSFKNTWYPHVAEDGFEAVQKPNSKYWRRPKVPRDFQIKAVDELEQGNEFFPERRMYGQQVNDTSYGDHNRPTEANLMPMYEAMARRHQEEQKRLFKPSEPSFEKKLIDYSDPAKKQKIIAKIQKKMKTETAEQNKERIKRYNAMGELTGPLRKECLPPWQREELRRNSFTGKVLQATPKKLRSLGKAAKKLSGAKKPKEPTQIERMDKWAKKSTKSEEYNIANMCDRIEKDLEEDQEARMYSSDSSICGDLYDDDFYNPQGMKVLADEFDKVADEFNINTDYDLFPMPAHQERAVSGMAVFDKFIDMEGKRFEDPTFRRLLLVEVSIRQVSRFVEDLFEFRNKLRAKEAQLLKQNRWHDMEWKVQRQKAHELESQLTQRYREALQTLNALKKEQKTAAKQDEARYK